MIKQFNTAFTPATSGSGSKGGNALIWILIIGVGTFLGYKYIQNRNKIVTVQEEN